VACPYDARTFVKEITPYFPEHGLTPYEQMMYAKHQTGVPEKCSFCAERLARGEQPACVVACPAGVRHFGDLDDPDSEVSRLVQERQGQQLKPELGTKPCIYYLPRYSRR
jgi:molybdopterin-containing oxidoreductase family iron-sulfur binding subunit